MKKLPIISGLSLLFACLSGAIAEEENTTVEASEQTLDISAGHGADDLDFARLFEERARSIAVVEFYIDMEMGRQPSTEIGFVADDNGLIVLLDSAIPEWVPLEQMKDFKVYSLRNRAESPARYLGHDPLNGWHFVRAEGEVVDRLTPITVHDSATPVLGEFIWGIGVMGKDFDFEPYFLSSRLSLLRKLPQTLGLSVTPVSSPGSLIFSRDGRLVGWGGASYLSEYVLHVGDDQFPVGLQGMRESGAFLPASEVLPFLDRVPESPETVRVPWLGVPSLQPVESEVATYLGLEGQSAVVLSEIVSGGPADEAGLQRGDIAVAIDGEPIPRFRPDRVVPRFFEREILRHQPGDVIGMTVIRDEERLELEVELGEEPRNLRQADRRYFERVGLTVREFLMMDGIARRVGPETGQGVVVQFVRPNSPADSAGLTGGDWIQEIDGNPVESYEEAVELIGATESARDRREIVFLVSRRNETSVVRVNLR